MRLRVGGLFAHPVTRPGRLAGPVAWRSGFPGRCWPGSGSWRLRSSAAACRRRRPRRGGPRVLYVGSSGTYYAVSRPCAVSLAALIVAVIPPSLRSRRPIRRRLDGRRPVRPGWLAGVVLASAASRPNDAAAQGVALIVTSRSPTRSESCCQPGCRARSATRWRERAEAPTRRQPPPASDQHRGRLLAVGPGPRCP